MDEIREILKIKKGDISGSLDKLVQSVSDILTQKNNRIYDLQNRVDYLENTTTKQININNTIDINELKESKINNILIKKLIKKIIIINKQKHTIKKLQTKSNTIDTSINTKDLSAFKIIALELDEKEKIIKENLTTINNLTDKINKYEKENKELNIAVENLKNKTDKLEEVNKLQNKTIEAITNELSDKKNKINELREYFVDIMNDYNDILLRVGNE